MYLEYAPGRRLKLGSLITIYRDPEGFWLYANVVLSDVSHIVPLNIIDSEFREDDKVEICENNGKYFLSQNGKSRSLSKGDSFSIKNHRFTLSDK